MPRILNRRLTLTALAAAAFTLGAPAALAQGTGSIRLAC